MIQRLQTAREKPIRLPRQRQVTKLSLSLFAASSRKSGRRDRSTMALAHTFPSPPTRVALAARLATAP